MTPLKHEFKVGECGARTDSPIKDRHGTERGIVLYRKFHGREFTLWLSEEEFHNLVEAAERLEDQILDDEDHG